MENLLNTISGFLGSVFGNASTGIRPGGILSTLVGAGAGYFFGGGVGGILGAFGGVALGGIVNQLLDGSLGRQNTGEHSPGLIRPQVVQGATQNLTVATPDGQKDVPLPATNNLPRPWESTSLDAFIGSIRTDTSAITGSPENLQTNLPLMQATLNDRNQSLYDRLNTVYVNHRSLEQYNSQTRPAMMRDLGLTDRDVFLPPKYEGKLEFKFLQPERADRVAREARLDLKEEDVKMKLDEASWRSYSPVQQLALMEKSVNNRSYALSQRHAKLKADMEAQGRKVPMDLDFSFNSFKDRMKWMTFSLIYESSDTRLENAFRNLYEGKPSEQITHDGKKYLSRTEAQERAAEEEFRNEMEKLTVEFASTATFGGEEAAKQMREMTSIVIEERRLAMDSRMIQLTKESWIQESQRWAESVKDFPAEMRKYSAQYAAGGPNSEFRMMQEIESNIILGNAETKAEADAIRQEIKRSHDVMKRATTGVRELLETLKVNDLRHLPAVNVSSLPTSNEFLPSSGKDKDIVRDSLDKQVKEYNDKRAAFLANQNDARANAEFRVAYDHLIEEFGSYLKSAEAVMNGANSARERHLAELSKASTAGTNMEGYKGAIFVVMDKRNGKNQKTYFYGVKKGDEVIITGVARELSSGERSPITFFGNDMSDIEQGVRFNPKTMEGAKQVMEKFDQTQNARLGRRRAPADPVAGAVTFQPVQGASDTLSQPAPQPQPGGRNAPGAPR